MRPATLAAAAAALAAGCTTPLDSVFEVDGAARVLVPQRGTVVALWEIRTPSEIYYYKYGVGLREGPGFTLEWIADPPPEAINDDGIGVAIFALLPDQTVVDDGEYTLRELPIQGISGSTAVIYKLSTAAGPAWSEALLPRFSCARCVRSAAGTGDRFELAPCASVTLEEPAAPLCDW